MSKVGNKDHALLVTEVVTMTTTVLRNVWVVMELEKKLINQNKNMLYLINCEIVETAYMGETTKYEMIHIVEATSESEAEDKLRRHYQLQDSEYNRWVNINYINQVIK